MRRSKFNSSFLYCRNRYSEAQNFYLQGPALTVLIKYLLTEGPDPKVNDLILALKLHGFSVRNESIFEAERSGPARQNYGWILHSLVAQGNGRRRRGGGAGMNVRGPFDGGRRHHEGRVEKN